MILVDTSVWIDHLRRSNSALVQVLEQSRVLAHPWIIGEIALGTLRSRSTVLTLLHGLPQATVATDVEVLLLIERHSLFGRGVGYIDAQLLTSVRLTSGATLWTHDRRLTAAAAQLGVDDSEVGPRAR